MAGGRLLPEEPEERAPREGEERARPYPGTATGTGAAFTTLVPSVARSRLGIPKSLVPAP